MKIIEPSQSEKDRTIEIILSKGLVKPKSVWKMLSEIRNLFGFGFIFWDAAQAIVMAAATILAISFFIPFTPEEYKYSAVFGFSPLLFVSLMFFTETIERMDPLYELKQTCKYTIRQITAFRIMFFSLIGIIYCVIIVSYQSESIAEIFSLLPVSLCSLLICSFASLSLIRRIAWKFCFVLAALFSLPIVFLPFLILGEKWEAFLAGLPAVIALGAAVLFGVLFLIEIKKLMKNQWEDLQYAIG